MIFFFKQKTAYEIADSDWSSDVCSSDLVPGNVAGVERRGVGERQGLEIKKVQVCKSVYGNNKFDGSLLRNF